MGTEQVLPIKDIQYKTEEPFYLTAVIGLIQSSARWALIEPIVDLIWLIEKKKSVAKVERQRISKYKEGSRLSDCLIMCLLPLYLQRVQR